MSHSLDNQKLVKVMTYGSSHVAHTAKGLLAENGITAQVQGDMIADAFSYYGSAVSKTDIVTLEEDAERALAILKKMEQEATVPKSQSGPWADGPTLWLCDQCDEQNAFSFDHCWSCQAGRSENPRTVPVPLDDEESAVFESDLRLKQPGKEDDSPYRVPNSGTVTAMSRRVESEDYAFKIAIVSIAVFPLGAFGLFVTLRCLSRSAMSFKLVCALFLNVMACVFTIFLILLTQLK